MDCEKFDEALYDLREGDSRPSESGAIVEHAATCQRCSEVESRYRALRDQLPDLREAPPPWLEQRILAASAARQRQRTVPLGLRLRGVGRRVADLAMRPQLVMSAVLVLLLGTGLLVWQRGRRPATEVAIIERGIPDAPYEATPEAPAAANASEAPSDSRDVSGAYAAALAQYDSRRYNEALPALEAVAAQNGPNAASAAFFAAECVRRTAGCGKALERFDAVALRFKGTSSAQEAQWQAAECHRALGERDRALDIYRSLSRTPAYAERVRPVLAELERPQLPAQRNAAKAAAAPPPTRSAAAGEARANRAHSRGSAGALVREATRVGRGPGALVRRFTVEVGDGVDRLDQALTVLRCQVEKLDPHPRIQVLAEHADWIDPVDNTAQDEGLSARRPEAEHELRSDLEGADRRHEDA